MVEEYLRQDEVTSLRGRSAFIVQGVSPIGRSIAALLTAEGANVVLIGPDAEKLAEVEREVSAGDGSCHSVEADLASVADMQSAFASAGERLGSLDILINNLDVPAKTVHDLDPDSLEHTVRQQFLSFLLCSKLASESMKGRGGHIINLVTVNTETFDGQDIYRAVRGAMDSFSVALAKEVSDDGIKVSFITAGPVDPEPPAPELRSGNLLAPDDLAVAVAYCLIQPPRCDVLYMDIRPHLYLWP